MIGEYDCDNSFIELRVLNIAPCYLGFRAGLRGGLACGPAGQNRVLSSECRLDSICTAVIVMSRFKCLGGSFVHRLVVKCLRMK